MAVISKIPPVGPGAILDSRQVPPARRLRGRSRCVEPTLLDLKGCLMASAVPAALEDCEFCGYIAANLELPRRRLRARRANGQQKTRPRRPGFKMGRDKFVTLLGRAHLPAHQPPFESKPTIFAIHARKSNDATVNPTRQFV